MNNTSTKKRSKIISLLLSVLTPGLGHLYNGKLIWAAAIPLIYIIVYIIIYYFSLIKSFTFLLIFVLFSIYVYIFSMVHSVVLAKRNSDYTLKKYNHIYIYLIWPLLYYNINILLPYNSSIGTFDIPTVGMENTLMVNDMVMADMDYHRNTDIKRNDIIIFSDPKPPHKYMVKRAIAFEGEKISIVSGKIFINEKEFKEDNPNIVYQNDNRDDIPVTIIPEDHIFVLGDNRPNSLDSRHFGSIPEDNVKGKPLYIYFSDSLSRIGLYLH